MIVLGIFASLLSFCFLCYSGFVIKNKGPELKRSIIPFIKLSSLASIISMILALLFLAKNEAHFMFSMASFSMVFSFLVLIIVDTNRKKDDTKPRQ